MSGSNADWDGLMRAIGGDDFVSGDPGYEMVFRPVIARLAEVEDSFLGAVRRGYSPDDFIRLQRVRAVRPGYLFRSTSIPTRKEPL